MWTVDTRNVKRLNSYEAAKKFFEESDKTDGDVPLDEVAGKRKMHLRLKKHGDNYAAYLYHTPLVTFMPDKVRLKLDDRQSSAKFIDAVVNISCCLSRGQPYILALVGDSPIPKWVTGDTIDLVPDNRAWRTISPVRGVIQKTVDRQRGASVRVMSKDYFHWLDVRVRMGNQIKTPYYQTGFLSELLADVPYGQPIPQALWPDIELAVRCKKVVTQETRRRQLLNALYEHYKAYTETEKI